MGSVERVLVLGIVVVIVAILGITIWSATGDEAGAVLPATDGGVVATVPAASGAAGNPALTPLLADKSGGDAPVSEIDRWRQLREAEARARGETVGNAPPVAQDAVPAAGLQPAAGPVPLENTVSALPAVDATMLTPVIVPEAPKAAPKAATVPGEHTVVAGDSLWKIAHRVYGDANIQEHIDAILLANPQVDEDNLQIGTKLKLPGKDGKDIARQPAARQVEALSGKLYEVKKGDTLSGIARTELGSTGKWKEIYELNRERIQDPQNIAIGTTLRLPKN